MAEENLENKIETIVGGYLNSYFLDKTLEKNGWDHKAREALGGIMHGDSAFYSEAGPDAVKYVSELYKDTTENKLKNEISYDNLVATYSNEDLKKFLEILPPLKNGNAELKKAHEEFYKLSKAYRQGIELMDEDPAAFRELAIRSAGNKADAYYAGGRTESSMRVFAVYSQIARRKLYEAIDKVKPSKKKE